MEALLGKLAEYGIVAIMLAVSEYRNWQKDIILKEKDKKIEELQDKRVEDAKVVVTTVSGPLSDMKRAMDSVINMLSSNKKNDI